MSQNKQQDIIVVGGGHAGLTQTLILAQNGFQVTCVDRDDITHAFDASLDGRTTAISYGSHQLMKAAGIWDDLLPHACPIQDIQILDGTSAAVLLDFQSDDLQKEVTEAAFGWIIENNIIRKTLYAALQKQKNAQHLSGESVKDFELNEKSVRAVLSSGDMLEAHLIIGADGRQSFTREWMNVGARQWSYDQGALVCIITHEKPHNNIAVEHFKEEGPFAILPMLDDAEGKHRSSIVWTQHGEHSKRVLAYEDDTFLTALNARFPSFYGRVLSTGKRFSYPLSLVHAYDYVAPRMALIADAAHGIHPIAGQGLNMGLRDVATLSEILIKTKNDGQDIGDIDVLKKYQSTRRPDNITMAGTTHFLNKLFSNNIPPMRLARKIGLKLVSRIKPAKKFFMRQAMGTSGHLPKTIRDGKI